VGLIIASGFHFIHDRNSLQNPKIVLSLIGRTDKVPVVKHWASDALKSGLNKVINSFTIVLPLPQSNQ
jgi:hypothetical protein